MRVVVPFDTQDPKSRLADVLAPSERKQFSDRLLRDVLEAVVAAGGEPEVLATAPVDLEVNAFAEELSVIVDDRPLTEAVNGVLEGGRETAVVMADLGLVTPESLRRLFGRGREEHGVTIAPGVGGGTNALVVRHGDFRVDYHDCSYRDHRIQCAESAIPVTVVDSFRLAVDIDEPTDLVELLIHGDGSAHEWLTKRFALTTGRDHHRVSVRRR